jgi:hypothetical protein
MKKMKVTIISEKALDDLLNRIDKTTTKQEEKDERSICRTIWDFLNKPVIGKPRR